MKIKYIITLLILTSCTGFAQEVLSNLSWNISIPVGKTADYAGDVSYRGFTLSFRRFIDRENSIGILSGWNIFDEKSAEPINLQGGNGSGTVSGTQIHSVNSIPILAGFFHYFGKSSDMRLFAGLNVGTYYILQRLEIGVFIIDNDNWHFGLAPEAGMIFEIDNQGSGIQVGGRYNYAFDSGTAFGGSENNFYSFYEINVGFTFSSSWF